MKSYKKIKNLSLLFLSIVLANACTKDFKALNTPANLISEDLVTSEMLLSSVEFSAGGGLGAGDAGNYCGMTVSVSNAPFDDRFYDGAWHSTYTSIANNLAAIIRKTADKPELVNKKAIARILKAWAYSQATDIYGDIPYFDANKKPQDAILNPKYDTQESIYQDIFKELKEATAELDAGKATFEGGSDLIYNGDVSKWKKFANSLRLRLALRVRFANPQMAQTNMSDLQETDLILSPDDAAMFFTSDDVSDHWNGAYTSLVTYGGGPDAKELVGKTMLDILSNGNAQNPIDPRIKIYADTAYASWPSTLNPPIPNFGYRGQPLLGNVPVEEKYPYGYESTSRFSDFWYVPVIEQPILKASEMYFALAEAALYNIRTGDANAYFKKGIEASVIETENFYNRTKGQVGKVEAIIRPNWTSANTDSYVAYKQMKQNEINSFLSSPITTLTGTDEQKFEQIINQKIVALYPNELEGWSEWRRSGYPKVLIAADEGSILKGSPYRRDHYPQTESLINTQNYNEALSRIGGKDDLLKRVWWDANPDAPHKHSGTVEWRAKPWQP